MNVQQRALMFYVQLNTEANGKHKISYISLTLVVAFQKRDQYEKLKL